MNKIKSNKGFTIIEVVLVLAIAGLIFLMVFVALPNLQRSQRDTQRRDDYAALASNITAYVSNNGGRLPTAGATLDTDKYINESGNDPYGNAYQLNVAQCTAAAAEVNAVCAHSGTLARIDDAATDADGSLVYVVTNADCSGVGPDGAAIPAHNAANRKFAVYGQLESGSYCQAE